MDAQGSKSFSPSPGPQSLVRTLENLKGSRKTLYRKSLHWLGSVLAERIFCGFLLLARRFFSLSRILSPILSPHSCGEKAPEIPPWTEHFLRVLFSFFFSPPNRPLPSWIPPLPRTLKLLRFREEMQYSGAGVPRGFWRGSPHRKKKEFP